jgi:hypothetical protein
MDQGCHLTAYTELCVASSDYVFEAPKQAASGTIVSDEKMPVPIEGRYCTKKPCKQWVYVDSGDNLDYTARQANLSKEQFLDLNSLCFDRSSNAVVGLESQLEAWHWYCVAV